MNRPVALVLLGAGVVGLLLGVPELLERAEAQRRCRTAVTAHVVPRGLFQRDDVLAVEFVFDGGVHRAEVVDVSGGLKASSRHPPPPGTTLELGYCPDTGVVVRADASREWVWAATFIGLTLAMVTLGGLGLYRSLRGAPRP